MTEYTIERDDDRPLRFTGEIIAEASSRGIRGPSQNRWQELTLYRTAGGKMIARRVGRTQWQGERDRHEAVAVDTPDQVVAFLGLGEAAKELYRRAGIDVAQRVD
jgi:hypothetical protein